MAQHVLLTTIPVSLNEGKGHPDLYQNVVFTKFHHHVMLQTKSVHTGSDVILPRPSANRQKLLKMAEKSAVHLAHWAERFVDEMAQVCPF